MKFDDIVNKILNEDVTDGGYKSLSTEDLIERYKEELHDFFTSDYGSYSHDQSSVNSEDIQRELLSRGIPKEELKAIQVEVEAKSNASEEPQHDEYEHKGWPGDGSGEDDFADYNQMEGDDY